MTKTKIKSSDRTFNIVVDVLLFFSFLIVVLPLLHILACSLSSTDSVISGEVLLWPKEFSLKGYEAVFKNDKILMGYRNTILYTLGGTLVNVVMTILAAYPLSRKDLPGRTLFLFMFTFTMIFSGGLIPTYLLNSKLGLVNNPLVLIIPGSIAVWNLMIARNYFENSISNELIEAAQIDGCNTFQVLRKIILPLSKPIIAVLCLFYAVSHWNAFFDAFIYINDQNLMPLQVILRDVLISNQIDSSQIVDPDTLAAMEGMDQLLKYSTIIVSCLPIWCVYPFIQKFFVKGVMVGAIKG